MLSYIELKNFLDFHYNERNSLSELSGIKPDPLVSVKENMDNVNHVAEMAILSALLSYGNAGQILRTLRSIDFTLLDKTREDILNADFPFYRFQTSDDIKRAFLAMHTIIQSGGIKPYFCNAYHKHRNVIAGINAMIEALWNAVESVEKGDGITNGLKFLFGKPSCNVKCSSPFKRWNMFLRWFVRKDNIDLGLWADCASTEDLILPLDTHTFRLGQKFGLIQRKSYDLQAALEITQSLRMFCAYDPIRYDFALYRLGQERLA